MRCFGYNRKYAIGLLKKPIRIKKQAPKKRGAKPCYQDEELVKALQLPLLGFNSDSGGEFINKYLINYLNGEKKQPLLFTRSRPNKKNDNAHVEQKNWTHVRHLFGYWRLGEWGVIAMMNDLYKNEWRLYQNFFMPTMILIEKTRIGARYRKKYDAPKTPYQRILQEPTISQEQKEKLAVFYKILNPFVLKQAIQRKLKRILHTVASA